MAGASDGMRDLLTRQYTFPAFLLPGRSSGELERGTGESVPVSRKGPTMTELSFKPELTLSVLVTDFAAARRWYTEKLGFKEMYAVEEVGWVELQTPLGGATIGLNRLEAAHPGPGSVTITFGVQDIDATRAELEKRGVAFDGPTNEIPGMVKLAPFHDPDGNALMLAQTLGQ